MKHDFKEPRLARWHEWLIYGSIALLLVSGLGWLLLNSFGQIEGEFGPEPHPALPWLLMIHGVAAYGFLIIAAALFPLHIRFGWIKKRNRLSGASLIALCFVLASSGLGLYYATAEALRAATSVAHWAIGIGIPLVLALHVILGKATRAERLRDRQVTACEADAVAQPARDKPRAFASVRFGPK